MSSRKGKLKAQASPEHGRQQLWFFLNESMDTTSFTQGIYTLEDMKKHNLNLETCIRLTGGQGVVNDHAFYIYSSSMASAVRLLNDESVIATYNLYCTKDTVVTVIVRKANDPSPNTSRTPSHANSRSSRQKSLSTGSTVPEVFIQPKIRHASESTDTETLETIRDERNMVSIIANKNVFTFTKDYLLGMVSEFYLFHNLFLIGANAKWLQVGLNLSLST